MRRFHQAHPVINWLYNHARLQAVMRLGWFSFVVDMPLMPARLWYWANRKRDEYLGEQTWANRAT